MVLLYDNDVDGHRHLLQVARSILPVAVAVKVVELSGAKDISAWRELGHTREELIDLVTASSVLDAQRLRALEQRWFPESAATDAQENRVAA